MTMSFGACFVIFQSGPLEKAFYSPFYTIATSHQIALCFCQKLDSTPTLAESNPADLAVVKKRVTSLDLASWSHTCVNVLNTAGRFFI